MTLHKIQYLSHCEGFLKSTFHNIFEWLFNLHSVCIWKRRMVFITILALSGIPPLWIGNYMVFMCGIFNKGLICNEILGLHEILVTHTKFLNEFRNLLVLLNFPFMNYIIRSILEYLSYIAKVLRFQGYRTLKKISINQYFIKSICDIPPWKTIDFETLQIIKSLLQSIIWTIEKKFMVTT